MTTIYTLKLEQGKYYIGRTKQPKHRILHHFTDNGSEWTKKYKPISVVSQIKGDEFDEEKYTLIAMDKYGVENVRGGSYCKVKLTNNDIEKAQQTIYSIKDKCYKCGKKGHFVKNCGKEPIVCDDNPIIDFHKTRYSSMINYLTKEFGELYSHDNHQFTCWLKEQYLDYSNNCDSECDKCNKHRILYLYSTETHNIYSFCDKCYNGDEEKIFTFDDELGFYHMFAFENEEIKTNSYRRVFWDSNEKHPKYNPQLGLDHLKNMARECNPELYEKIFPTKNTCVACSGTGTSYWSDDIYGSCLECCCINCSKFREDCKCHECDKCKEIICVNENHDCTICDRCNKYSSYGNCICELCIDCNEFSVGVDDVSHNKCYECNQQWCVNCFEIKIRCKEKHTGSKCCIEGIIGCDINYCSVGPVHNH